MLRQKASSPKLHVLNTALTSALSHLSFKEAKEHPHFWNRLIESVIGAHLLNLTVGSKIKVYYWKEGNKEVDFVLKKGNNLVALEVKNNRKNLVISGMEVFSSKFHPDKTLLIGKDGISVERFLLTNPEDFF